MLVKFDWFSQIFLLNYRRPDERFGMKMSEKGQNY